jgi:glycosyltransferase involved in cell wall biosynthesis
MGLKILFLSHKFYPDVGGIEVNSEILAEAFCRAGHSVHLLTWSDGGAERKFPYSVIRNPWPMRLIREHIWADVVYENNICLRLSWPALIFNKPSVIALRTWIPEAKGKVHLIVSAKKFFLKRARAVIAVSNSVRAKCWPSATVIGNPYRSELFRKTGNVVKANRIVFIGRLVTDKGADIAIKALYHLLEYSKHTTREKYSLTIIGDGPERSKLEILAKQLNVERNVVFQGSLTGDALATCLTEHKFIFVPSLWEEPFGNVALEGLACGCIPIVSNGGGLPDAVGDAGIVVPRGNAQAFAACVAFVQNNSGIERMLLEAAPSHLANHRPEIVAKRYLDVINRAVLPAEA